MKKLRIMTYLTPGIPLDEYFPFVYATLKQKTFTFHFIDLDQVQHLLYCTECFAFYRNEQNEWTLKQLY